MRETGLEPVRDYHTPLKRARLPIPPLSQIVRRFSAADIIITNAKYYVNTFFILFCFNVNKVLNIVRRFDLVSVCNITVDVYRKVNVGRDGDI